MPFISIRDLKWRYPTITYRKGDYVLNGISIDIQDSQFIGITGQNGSGKSTLLYIIKGKIPQEINFPNGKEREYFDGSITVDGKLYIGASENGIFIDKDISHRIGILGHEEPIIETNEAVESLIKKYICKEDFSGFYNFLISNNYSKFSAILKENTINASLWEIKAILILALIENGKDIILLDDPTSGLDPAGRLNLSSFLKDIKSKAFGTFIISSLELDFLKDVADKIYILDNGRIKDQDIDTGTPIKGNAPLYAEIQRILTTRDAIPENLQEIRGFKVEREDMQKGELLISIRNLMFSFDGLNNALDDLNLDIYRGEFIALIGPNGSGKTTLSKILSGEISGWQGTIELKGGLRYKGKLKKMPNLIGYSSQLPDLNYQEKTVSEILREATEELGLPPEEERDLIQHTLEKVSLAEREKDRIQVLSRGESRRLALALAIVSNPQIIILDEPTLGQDFERAREIMELLMDLNKAGLTIVVITHDMGIVAEYARRVVVLKNGRKIFDGKPENLFENDEIMRESSLVAPSIVAVSKKLKENGIIDNLLLSAREWIEFFNFEKQRRKYVALKFHDLKEYARKMSVDILKKYGRPDAIIYIERGGMVVGRLLSDFLAVKQIYSIKASYYADTGEPMPSVNIGKFEYELKGGDGYVLLVDDIADTGKTIEAVLNSLKEKVQKKIVVATVVYKPQSVIKPDVYAYTVQNDTWIVFDYEETETLNSFLRKDNKEGILFMKDNFGVP